MLSSDITTNDRLRANKMKRKASFMSNNLKEKTLKELGFFLTFIGLNFVCKLNES